MTEKDKKFSQKTALMTLNVERSAGDFLKLYHTVRFILFHLKSCFRATPSLNERYYAESIKQRNEYILLGEYSTVFV